MSRRGGTLDTTLTAQRAPVLQQQHYIVSPNYSALQKQVLCLQDLVKGWATTGLIREGALNPSLSTQSSFQFTKSLPKARILPVCLCTPLRWAPGVRRDSDPKMDQSPLYHPPNRSPRPGSQQPWEEGVPKSQVT